MKRLLFVPLPAALLLVVLLLVPAITVQESKATDSQHHPTDTNVFIDALFVSPANTCVKRLRRKQPQPSSSFLLSTKLQRTKSLLAAERPFSTKGFGKSNSDGKQSEISYIVDTSTELQKLKQFLSSSNNIPIQADLSNVEVGFDKITGRRGLYATKNIGAKDKIICKIPTDFLLALSNPNENINDNTVVGNDDGDDDDDDDDDKKEQKSIVQSAIYYLNTYVNNPSMFQQWESYLRTIPNKIELESSTPDLYDEEMIQLLEFPKILKSAMNRKHAIQHAITTNNISLEQLQYATWLVSTRSFTIPIADSNQNNNNENIEYDDRGQVLVSNKKNVKIVRVLVPYLDIVNHSSPKHSNARWTILDPNKDDAWFALESTRPIKAGKEITISYGGSIVAGSGTTIDLLLNYGFVHESTNNNDNHQLHWNPIDTVMLKKGGDDCYTSINQWTTTLQEDVSMLQMMSSSSASSNDNNIASTTTTTDLYLKKVLQFRIQMKNAYQQLP